MSEYVVELQNITKCFPGVLALDNVGIQIKPGEVHGLIGENGAGKSTLIKTLAGVHTPDSGTIFVEGKEVRFKNPNHAKKEGIACVFQELNIVDQLSIADNLFMNNQILQKNKILLDVNAMVKKGDEVMESLGQKVDSRKQCYTLGMGVKQMVEIGKATMLDAKLIIMDEPTSSLGESEVKQLFKTIDRLKKLGIAILFVSHKLEELFEICDRVTVMRDGKHVCTELTSDLDNDKLIHAMVGRTLSQQFPYVECKKGEEALRAEDLVTVGSIDHVSFSAYNGEILAFAGLVGAGRTETMRSIFGADPRDSGKVYIHGKLTNIKSPKQAVENKIAFLTEDRKAQGLVLAQGVNINAVMASFGRCLSNMFFNDSHMGKLVTKNVDDMNIKTASQNTPVVQLSGGNQQKVVIAKWLNTEADIFIFDEPTRGIDVGAKVDVYNLMNRLKSEGKCVIMISSDLPEILGVSDRVLAMCRGKITGEFFRNNDDFNQEAIMQAAWGGVK